MPCICAPYMHKVKDVLYAVKSGFPPFPRKVFGGRIVLSVLQKIEPSKTRPLIWRVWCMYGVCMVYVPFQLAKTIFGRKKEVAEQGHPDPSRTTMTTMNLKSLMCPKSGRRGRRKKKNVCSPLHGAKKCSDVPPGWEPLCLGHRSRPNSLFGPSSGVKLSKVLARASDNWSRWLR